MQSASRSEFLRNRRLSYKFNESDFQRSVGCGDNSLRRRSDDKKATERHHQSNMYTHMLTTYIWIMIGELYICIYGSLWTHEHIRNERVSSTRLLSINVKHHHYPRIIKQLPELVRAHLFQTPFLPPKTVAVYFYHKHHIVRMHKTSTLNIRTDSSRVWVRWCGCCGWIRIVKPQKLLIQPSIIYHILYIYVDAHATTMCD